VVELEVLEAFDGIQWLRTGEEVSRRSGVSQPTVSRYLKKVLDVFESVWSASMVSENSLAIRHIFKLSEKYIN
jgi:hypothetical protein